MRTFFILLFLASCAHHPSPSDEKTYPEHAVLNHILQSYKKGCVDGAKKIAQHPHHTYHQCAELGQKHLSEVKDTLSK